MFKPTKAKSIAEYIDLVEEPRRGEIKKLFDFISKLLPSDKPYLTNSMIGWRSFHYKSKSGSEGDWPGVALASQKNYISVYVCALKNGQYIAEKHKADFPKANIGRSCIRFKKIADIDLSVLKNVIIESLKLGFGF